MSRFLLILRALLFPAIIGAIYFVAAGRLDLPFAWIVLGEMAAFLIALSLLADPAMMRERRDPGPGNRDRLTRPFAMVLMTAHWIIAGLDVGRYQWSLVPDSLCLAGVIGYALALISLLWTTRVNTFYSSVVRVQTERGHRPITTGPYRFIRHPGYAATMIAMITGSMALGSWLGMAPLLLMLPFFIRRTLLEDRMLQAELPGYAEYAQRVRYRLIFGVF